MEWAIGAFFALMLGLYIWSHVAVGKNVQPFIDDIFGVGPEDWTKSKRKRPPLGRAIENLDECNLVSTIEPTLTITI